MKSLEDMIRDLSPEAQRQVADFVKRLTERTTKPQAPQLSAKEFDKTFEEIADMIPDSAPPLSDEALSRESIYTREDEWNRNDFLPVVR